MHDLGKVNLLFQFIVQPEIKQDFENCRNMSQIPHGFLSAITISKNEFKELFGQFDKDDFSAFITAVYYHHDREDIYGSLDVDEYCEKYYLPY